MRTLNEIRLELMDRRIVAVARATGLHPATIRRILSKPDYIPALRTLLALDAYLGGSNG